MECITSNNNLDITIQGENIEERMKERLSILYENFETRLPFLFNTQNKLSFCHHKHHSEITIPLTTQFMAEDVTDDLASRLNAYILYAYRTLDGKKYHIIGFSKPTRENMYIFFMDSLMFGVVDEVTFDFYESIEYMFLKLRDIFFSIENEQAKTRQILQLEKMSAKDFWDAFNM